MSYLATSRYTAMAFLALLALLGTAYLLALTGPFLLDDFINLPKAKPSSWHLSDLLEATLSNNSGPLGRPVSALTFGLNYLTTGDNAVGFKFVNLGIHFINSLFVFLIVRTLSRNARDIGAPEHINPHYTALAVTFVWALHPLHMSTVMYVVQRMNLLSTLFVLASISCYLYARLEYLKNKALHWSSALASLAFGLLAIYSKENGALFVVYILLLELILFQHFKDIRRVLLRHKRHFVPISMLAGFCLIYSVYTFFIKFTSEYEFRDFTLQQRLLTQPGIVIDYLSQTLFPRVNDMGLYFDDIQLLNKMTPGFYLPFLVLALMAIAVLLLARPAPLISIGIAIFLISHVLESTFLPLEMKFEHRNYFGSIGILLAAVAAVSYLKILISQRQLVYALSMIVVVFLTSQTFARSQTWKDELTFNEFEVHRSPNSKRASSALAISLSRAGMTMEAIEEINRSISLHPDDSYAPVQRFQICALALSNCQQEYEKAINALSDTKITKDTVAILGDLSANVRAGYINTLSSSDMLELLITANNNNNQNLQNIHKARLLLDISEAFLANGDFANATESIMQSVALAPGNKFLLIRGAEITAGVGTIEESETLLRRVQRISPISKSLASRISAVEEHLDERRASQ